MKHHEPVAGHLVAAVLRARPEETALEVLARLRSEKPASVELVRVEAEDGLLEGVVPIARLIAAGDAPLGELVQRDFPRVTPDTRAVAPWA